MRVAIVTAIVLGLAACSKSGGGTYDVDYHGGDGDFYPGIAAPK